MKLHNVVTTNPELTFKIGVLCNDAFIENPDQEKDDWIIKGSSTSKAILESAIDNGINVVQMREENEELEQTAFDSKNKYILSLRKNKGKRTLYICGAPEKILERSKNAKKWEEEVNKLSEQGFRVVAVGYKEIKRASKDLNTIANNFDFVGLIAFADPLREDVKDAVQKCEKAGIKTILATGDHILTARYIAKQIGIETTEENIMEGSELASLSDAELEKRINKVSVFARVEPKDKLRIVSAWQKKGKVVAMTGDGVNDAPAIKKADIGIALGSGTDVAIESSDLVLMDDSFSTIVNTIEEGRVVLDNLRKSISYVLADSFASAILISFSTIIFGWPLPILAVQILWNNIIEDALPTISFAFEPKEKKVMERKPISKKAPLLTKEMKTLIFATGIIDQFFILFIFWMLYSVKGLDIEFIRTIIFGCVCVDTAFVIFAYKNLRKNIWQFNPLSNMWLNISAIISIIAFAISIYVPMFQSLLQTVPLGIGSWVLIIGTAILSLAGVEITKYFFIARHQTED
jgi:Ca2+-transporting ATPase